MIFKNLLLFSSSFALLSCAGNQVERSPKGDSKQAVQDEIARILTQETEVTPVNQFHAEGIVTNSVPMLKTKSYRSSEKTQINNELTDKDLTNTLALSGGDEDLVQKWIEYFSEKDRDRFQRMLNRGEIYREIVQTILLENGLPSDLFYLALIESGFVTAANSHASAKGVWQFMKGTGEQYGLYVSSLVDEREDPIRATEAAAKYLRKLYSAYESWELAFAAYNAGEYRILTSIMKGETRNYWKLADKKLIPPETRNYVPKIIAAMKIARDLERYGFELNPEKESLIFPDLRAYEIESPVRVSSIAKALDVSDSEVLKYNPHLKNGVTPLDQERYEVWFPDVNSYENQRLLSSLKPEHRQTNKIARKIPQSTYRVKRGDTLSGISRKLNTSISKLRAYNNISGNKIFVGQHIRYKSRKYRSVSSKSSPQRVYRVRSGDTLSKISKRFNIRISNLKKYNNIRNNQIYVGQKITLSPDRELKVHVVRQGENLSLIARKYGLDIMDIKRKNKLRGNQIYPGQKLNI